MEVQATSPKLDAICPTWWSPSVSATRPRVGQALTYTITVTNHGPDPAADVRVIDTPRLPQRLVSLHVGRGRCQIGWPIKCRLGTLRSGERVTGTFTAIATTAGQQLNAVMAITASWDPAVGNSVALARTTITAAPPRFTG